MEDPCIRPHKNGGPFQEFGGTPSLGGDAMINDAHCHFFSRAFFEALAKQRGRTPSESASDLARLLQWEDPGHATALADRWVRALWKA